MHNLKHYDFMNISAKIMSKSLSDCEVRAKFFARYDLCEKEMCLIVLSVHLYHI